MSESTSGQALEPGHFQYSLLVEEDADPSSGTIIGLGTKSEWANRACLPDGYSRDEWEIIVSVIEDELGAIEIMEGHYLTSKSPSELRQFFSGLPIFEENEDQTEFLADCGGFRRPAGSS